MLRPLVAVAAFAATLAVPAPAAAHYLDSRTAVREVTKLARELAQEMQVQQAFPDRCRRVSGHELRCNAVAMGHDAAVQECTIYTQKVTVRFRNARTYRLRVIPARNVGTDPC